jgi:tRNA(fMet)-specific endonuclease VapC
LQFLLDTDTCVDLLRGVRAVVVKLERLTPDDCGISAVTSFELFAGAASVRDPRRETEKIQKFVDVIQELPFDADAARRAGALRSDLEEAGTPIGPYDLLIAAHALARDLALISANSREFGRVAGLRLENWR